jgi:coniferyl-aldehyde dehydrogenase
LHADCDLARATRSIVRGKLFNAGQTCIAPDYALVPRHGMGDFLRHYRETIHRFYPRLLDNPDYSGIIDASHFDRLTRLVADARNKGAEIAVIDPARELPAGEIGAPAARKMAPVVLTGVDEGMDVMREEIFGPLLPIVPYDTLDEAISRVNAGPRPLALYYFDTSRDRVKKVLERTVSGGVAVNDTVLQFAQVDLPFGGIGASGMGAYHGREGFLTFSHAKGMLRQGPIGLSGLFEPPYPSGLLRLMRLWVRGMGRKG